MTDQLTIPVPAAGPARPIVIPPGAVRCWVRADADEDDPFETHWVTEAEALADGKAKQLPYVCVVASCIGCRTKLEGEYGGILHCPDWVEAERVAQCDGWKIGTRGEFTCPACQEGR